MHEISRVVTIPVVHKTSALRLLHNINSYEVAFLTFTDKVNVS